MATRNFVPRSGSEGQLGTVEKPWGKIVADTLIGSISGSLTSTGSFGSLSIPGKITAGSLSVTNITASANISASGDILSDGRIFEKGTSVIDHATAMAIVFGG